MHRQSAEVERERKLGIAIRGARVHGPRRMPDREESRHPAAFRLVRDGPEAFVPFPRMSRFVVSEQLLIVTRPPPLCEWLGVLKGNWP